jgi:hypothetical protein
MFPQYYTWTDAHPLHLDKYTKFKNILLPLAALTSLNKAQKN